MKAKSTELAKDQEQNQEQNLDQQSKQAAADHKLKRNEKAYKLAKAIKKRSRYQPKTQLCSGSDKRSESIIIPDHTSEEKQEIVKFWIEDLILLQSDKAILRSDAWLNSSIVDATQKILSRQFPCLEGFQSVGCGQGMSFNTMQKNFIQILHDEQRKHWLAITNIGTTEPSMTAYSTNLLHVFSSKFPV